MPIEVRCRECGKRYRVPDHRAGEEIDCRECGAGIPVPGRSRSRNRNAARSNGRSGSSRRRPARGRGGASDSTKAYLGAGAGVVVGIAVIVGVWMALSGDDADDNADGNTDVAQNTDVADADTDPGSRPGGLPGDDLGFDPSRPGRPIPDPRNRPRANAGNPNAGNSGDAGNTGGDTPPVNRGNRFPPRGDNPAGNAPGGRPGNRFTPPNINNPFQTRGDNVANNTPADNAGAGGDETQKPPAGGSQFQQSSGLQRAGSAAVDWSVEVDPPAEQLAFDSENPVSIEIPRSSPGVFFPQLRSPIVAIGNNQKARDKRSLYDMRDRRRIGTLSGFDLGDQIAISPDGLFMAAGTNKGLAIIDVKKGEALGVLPLKGAFIETIGFAGSKKVAATTGWGEPLKVWTLPDGELSAEVKLPKRYTKESFTYSPGGRYVALFADDDGRDIRVYDVNDGKQAGSLDLPYDGFFSPTCRGLAFSPDGQELAGLFDVPGDDGKPAHIWCWSMSDGALADDIVVGDAFANVNARNAQGWPIEWFPGRQRWMVYGVGIVDREAGKLVWTFPPDGSSGPRRVLDDLHVAAVQNDTKRNRSTFTSFELPLEEISRSGDVLASGGMLKDIHLPPLTAADWSGVKGLVSGAAGTGWNVQPDPAPPAEGELETAITLQNRDARLNGLQLANAAAGRAALFYSRTKLDDPWKKDNAIPDKNPVWVEVYDLQRGRSANVLEVPFAAELMAFSPSGKFALMRLAHDRDRLDVFGVEDGNHRLGWRPYQAMASRDEPVGFGENRAAGAGVIKKPGVFEIGKTKIKAAVFVDDDHVLTVNGDFFTGEKEQSLVLWKLPECQAVYELKQPGQPGLSPGGKYLVIASGERWNVLDALTGEFRGSLKAEGRIGAAAFHHDGQRFGAISTNGPDHRFICWNLADGSVIADFPLPTGAKAMHWTGESSLLLDGSRLLDVDRKMIVWTYRLPAFGGVQSPLTPDGRHWYLSSKQGLRLLAANLPEQEVSDRLDAAGAKPSFVLQPGGSVSVQLNLGMLGGGGFDAEVRDAITRQFEAANIRVVPSAPVMLSINVTSKNTGEDVNLEINKFGQIGREQVKYAETALVCESTFRHQGQVVWTNSASFSNSYSGFMPEGKTAQQLGSESQRSSAKAFLSGYRPPTYIFTPGSQNGLGTSQLTANGPVPSG